jgi:exopolysaccharide biosynthesis polyprenyl glycosylphosphotransferase
MPLVRSIIAGLGVPEAPAAPAALAPRRGLNRASIFSVILVGLDTLTFAGAYLGFLHLRMMTGDPGGSNFWPLALCLGSVYVIFVGTNLYGLRSDSDSVRFAAELGLACLTAFALALLLQFAVFIFDLSRSRIALTAAFLVFTPVALASRRMLGRAFRVRAETQNFLIIGAGAEAIRFFRACRDHGTAQGLRFVDLNGARAGNWLDGPGTPAIDAGGWDDFSALIDGATEAIVVAEPFPMLPRQSVESLVRTHFFHAPILTVEAFHEKYWRKIPVVVMDPLWALRQDFRLARDSSYRFFKRGIDIVFSFCGLVLLLPVLAVCALATWMEVGAVFYCQERMRRDRETFTLYKFRTMEPVEDGELYTRDRDLRVTCVGEWLRKLRLDELPQLWNVLRGDMSLIGPRAEWSRCVQIYEREIPGYHFRHLVKPGITGWAQVNYPYGQSIEDTVEKLAYDLYYIKNYSLLLDASIVLKTLYVVLSFKGK